MILGPLKGYISFQFVSLSFCVRVCVCVCGVYIFNYDNANYMWLAPRVTIADIVRLDIAGGFPRC